MRSALLITFVLVLISALLGVIYNLMHPYFEKLGIKENIFADYEARSEKGLFRSKDFARSFEQLPAAKGTEMSRSNIFDIKFDAKDKSILYAATSGGLYVTKNVGDRWDRIKSGALGADGESVKYFAQDGANPARKYVAQQIFGAGRILKTRGGDFYEVYSTSMEADAILGIWISPSDTSTVYAGTKSGLFLASGDFGESWRERHDFKSPVKDLYVLRGDSSVIYALVGQSGFYKSVDSGFSWSNISNVVTRFGQNIALNDLEADPNNEAILYIASNKGLLKSENSASSFFEVQTLIDSEAGISIVSLDKRDSNIIYMGASNQIHKSGDAGISWQIKTLDTGFSISAISVSPHSSSIIFAGVWSPDVL